MKTLTLTLTLALTLGLACPTQAEELRSSGSLRRPRQLTLAGPPASWVGDTWPTRVQRSRSGGKTSTLPIVIGAAAGALTGFFVGSYVEHSVCEYSCPPGAMTWGITAGGAGAGAAIGWAIGRR